MALKFICFVLRGKCRVKKPFVNRKFYFFENRWVKQNFIGWEWIVWWCFCSFNRMKNLKKTLLTILSILPLTALGSGEGALPALYTQAISIIIFGIVLFFIKLNHKGKTILFVVYVITICLMGYFTRNMNYGEYLDSMSFINACIIIIPAMTLTITYFLIRNRFRRGKA